MTATLELKTDYLAAFPTIRERLREDGVLEWIDAALRNPPVPPSCAPFIAHPLIRPPSSARCFYQQSPSAVDGKALPGWIAFKGMEPLLPDFDRAVAHNRRSHQGYRLERFALWERKMPCAVSLVEAEREANVAAMIQTRHVAKFGGLARAPVPLAVFKHGGDIVKHAVDVFRQHLSREAQAAIAELLPDGLAIYAYYYPTAAHRVSAYIASGPGSIAARLESIEREKVAEVIDEWVGLVVRMFRMSLMPTTPFHALSSGSCLDVANMVIDGGITDLDSVVEFEELTTEADFFHALHRAVEDVIYAANALITGQNSVTPADGDKMTPSVDPFSWGTRPVAWLVARYVSHRFDVLVKEAVRDGWQLPSMLARYFADAPSFGETIDLIRTLHPRPDVEQFQSKTSLDFSVLSKPLKT